MKHLLTKTLLASCVCASLFSGCSQSQPEETRTIIIKVPTLSMSCLSNPDIKDAQQFMALAADKYKAANPDVPVDFVIEVFDYVDEQSAIRDTWDTADAPDLLYEGYFNMTGYVNTGRVASLDDIIDDSLRADISQSTWTQSGKGGKTYMLPYLSMQNILIYNRDLFEKAGLDDKYISAGNEIQNWSLEEWDVILDTLAENLPEDAFPMFMYGGSNQGDTHLMSLIRSRGGTIFDESGDFAFEEEKNLEGLQWLESGLDRGWYPPNCQNLEISDNQQLFENDRLGLYVFNNANFVLYDSMDKYGFVNFPGDIATSFITGFMVFDNGDDEQVALTKDFLQFIYQDDELMELSAGNIPESRRVREKYKDQIQMLDEFSANASHVIDFMNSSPNWQGKDNSVRSVFWVQMHELLSRKITAEQCAWALDKKCNEAIHER